MQQGVQVCHTSAALQCSALAEGHAEAMHQGVQVCHTSAALQCSALAEGHAEAPLALVERAWSCSKHSPSCNARLANIVVGYNGLPDLACSNTERMKHVHYITVTYKSLTCLVGLHLLHDNPADTAAMQALAQASK
jgi:hypothetical protein